MGVVYSRHALAVPEQVDAMAASVDLRRDLAFLVRHLTSVEKAEVLTAIAPLLKSAQTVYTNESAFLAQLSKYHPTFWGVSYESDAFKSVRQQARGIFKYVDRIERQDGGDLFYDFAPFGSQKDPVKADGENKSADVYIDFKGVAMAEALFDAVIAALSDDAFSVAEANAVFNPTQLATRAVKTHEGGDFANIPYDLFANAGLLKFTSTDMLAASAALRDFDKKEARAVVGHVLALHQPKENRNWKSWVQEAEIQKNQDAVGPALELAGALREVRKASLGEVLNALTAAKDISLGLEQEQRTSPFNGIADADKSTRAKNYARLARHVRDCAPLFARSGRAPLGTSDTLAAVLLLYYLNAGQIAAVIEKLHTIGADVMAEIRILSGLNFDDMMTIIDASVVRPLPMSADTSEDTGLPDVNYWEGSFNNYFITHADKFVKHRDHIEGVIANPGFEISHVTGDMASLIIVIESENKISAKNDGTWGLMQIGAGACEQITKKRLPPEQWRARALGDYQFNTEIGTRYLEWCFENYNPTHSLAKAIMLYNAEQITAIRYGKHHMHGIGEPAKLPVVTRNYIIKYLALSRMLRDNNDYQTWLASKDYPRQRGDLSQVTN